MLHKKVHRDADWPNIVINGKVHVDDDWSMCYTRKLYGDADWSM